MAVSSVSTATGGEIVVRMLKSLGVKTVYGVPGGQTLAITDAIYAEDDIRFVTTRHEGAAACMADATGRVTRRPGVCLATTGPGATNMITGIGGAMRDSSPVIAIACNNRLGDLDRDDAQGADHVSLFRPLVKWAKLVSRSQDIAQAIEEAFVRATSGCPGPVLLDFARDALEGEVDASLLAELPQQSRLWTAPERPGPDAGRLHEAIELLRQSRRPTLWVGNGVKVAGAGEDALELAELADMPVVTTFNGIGAVPTTHPLAFGSLSRMGTELSTRVLTDSDLVICVGNSLNGVSTGRWSMQLPERIVQIDIDPAGVGRAYARRSLGITADASIALRALAAAMRDDPGVQTVVQTRRERLRELAGAREAWWAAARKGVAASPGTVAPDTVMRSLREVAPDDTVAVVDAGNPGVWSYVWEIRAPDTYLKPVGFGNMGFAVPAAIAVKIARPEAPVIAFVGDGSLGMSLGELETIARERLGVCVVVMNDGSYGNIRQEQIVHYDGRTIGVDFTDVDFSAIARGCGLQAVRVTDEQAMVEAVREALSSDVPFLVDVVIDGDINAWTFPLFRQFEPTE